MKTPIKILGLLRHAKSDWDDMALRDFDRGLNERGRKGAALIGAHIREYGQPWDVIVASSAERVRRTLDAAGLDAPVRFEEAIYLADRATLLAQLRSIEAGAASAMIVGHNPGLQELIFDLVAPEQENRLFADAAEKYPTATFAVLELAIHRWADCAPGCGKLVHLTRPRDLDPTLGPERVG